MLLVVGRRRAVRHRRPLHASSRRSSSARRAASTHVRSRSASPLADAARRCSPRRSTRGLTARARRPQRHVGRAARASPTAFDGVELVPGGRARRGPAPGEGRRRGRPHPRAPARSPTTRSSRCSRASATGITERQFALALEFAMRERGASGNSFDPIIASGPNGAKPHAPPDRTASSSATSSSCATSAASSTATAPT